MDNRQKREHENREELHEEREEGFYWYSAVWHVLRPILIGLCAVLVVCGVVSGALSYVQGHFFAPVDEQDTAPIAFQVSSGNSLSRVANNLEAQNLIRNRSVFKYYADFLGYGQKIQSGDYVLRRNMSMKEILDTLTTGDGKPRVRMITIPPGWGVDEIATYLVKEGVLATREEFLSLCRGGEEYSSYYYIQDVLQSGSPKSRRYVLEGYLAADTYEIYTDATADDIIRKLLSQTGTVFREEYFERAEELGMTMDQVMTLASMIEKEATNQDFWKVSAVFHNRLKKGMTLGSDVTVKYGTGITRMALTSQDTSVKTPYNTYVNKGLPVGPICSPSPSAIHAALYPDETFMVKGQEYLYFCSTDPKSNVLYFSQTYEEHQQAVKIYQPLWQQYDKENAG